MKEENIAPAREAEEPAPTGRTKEKHPTLQVFARVLSPRCQLKSTERLVALALAARLNKRGECWPSVADIIARVGVGERTVQRALKTLIDSDMPIFARRWVLDHKTPVYFLVRNPTAFAEARGRKRIEFLLSNMVQKKGSGLRGVEQKRADQKQHARKVVLQARRERSDLTTFEQEELNRLESMVR